MNRSLSTYRIVRRLYLAGRVTPWSAPSSALTPMTTVNDERTSMRRILGCDFHFKRTYKAKTFLRHDIMRNVLAKFLDSKGVSQEAIENVISTKHYYAFHKEEFEHFERVVVWLGTIGLHSGEDLGAILMTHPSFLWIDINILESKMRWFLTNLKFQRHDLGPLLAKNPNIFFHHAEILGHFLQLLEMLRIDTMHIRTLITNRPDLLEHCENLEELQSLVKWLTMTIGLRNEQCGKILLQIPDLMHPFFQEPLPKIYEYLTRMGFEIAGLQRVMTVNPSFLLMGTKGVKHVARVLRRTFKARQRYIVSMMVEHPNVLTHDKNELKKLAQYLIDLGFGEKKLAPLIQHLPALLLQNIDHDLKPRVKFISEKRTKANFDMLDYPDCLLCPLPFIQMRFGFLEKMKKLESVRLRDALQSSDEKFATLAAESTLAKYHQFEEWWKITSHTKSEKREQLSKSHFNETYIFQ